MLLDPTQCLLAQSPVYAVHRIQAALPAAAVYNVEFYSMYIGKEERATIYIQPRFQVLDTRRGYVPTTYYRQTKQHPRVIVRWINEQESDAKAAVWRCIKG